MCLLPCTFDVLIKGETSRQLQVGDSEQMLMFSSEHGDGHHYACVSLDLSERDSVYFKTPSRLLSLWLMPFLILIIGLERKKCFKNVNFSLSEELGVKFHKDEGNSQPLS